MKRAAVVWVLVFCQALTILGLVALRNDCSTLNYPTQPTQDECGQNGMFMIFSGVIGSLVVALAWARSDQCEDKRFQDSDLVPV